MRESAHDSPESAAKKLTSARRVESRKQDRKARAGVDASGGDGVGSRRGPRGDLGDGVCGSGSNHSNRGNESADPASIVDQKMELDRFNFSDQFRQTEGSNRTLPIFSGRGRDSWGPPRECGMWVVARSTMQWRALGHV